jgi:hypothetical protein
MSLAEILNGWFNGSRCAMTASSSTTPVLWPQQFTQKEINTELYIVRPWTAAREIQTIETSHRQQPSRPAIDSSHRHQPVDIRPRHQPLTATSRHQPLTAALETSSGHGPIDSSHRHQASTPGIDNSPRDQASPHFERRLSRMMNTSTHNKMTYFILVVHILWRFRQQKPTYNMQEFPTLRGRHILCMQKRDSCSQMQIAQTLL